ncbi:30S ribosomal protein S6 [Candidatus Uhrbacteria bacterium]|nr:30S ribosomal protein S6 [Candidatus Uhrbacteria bacterium]
MNQYELLFIISSQYTDAEIEKIKAQVSAEIETVGGTIVKTENLGKIHLAYPIKKQNHGTYILVYFDVESSVLGPLIRKLSLTDEVLRHTTSLRPKDAEKRVFELTSYVAPLSEEARKEHFTPQNATGARPPRRRIEKVAEIVQVAPTVLSQTSPEESKMSMEELDKKLDEILKADITDNI